VTTRSKGYVTDSSKTIMSGNSDSDELEIDLNSLASVRGFARAWRLSHDLGASHVVLTPELFQLATTCGDTDNTDTGDKAFSHEKRETAVTRALRAAPSPRLRGFLARGNFHVSEVTAAPQKLTDAVLGLIGAARTCASVLIQANDALDAFIVSIGGGERVGDGESEESVGVSKESKKNSGESTPGNANRFDQIRTAVLLTRLPFGTETRTVEQWLWLCTAVIDSLELEQKVVAEIAAYLVRGDPETENAEPGSSENENEKNLYQLGKLLGCAEVWKARAFVDETLLQALADAEE
jgi:hypothetical protein